MMRYYFDVHDGGHYLDNEGVELSGPTEARQEAMQASGEILRDRVPASWDKDEWTMIVRNGDGETVCELRFSALNKSSDVNETLFDDAVLRIVSQQMKVDLISSSDQIRSSNKPLWRRCGKMFEDF